jgi:hypothetical protein
VITNQNRTGDGGHFTGGFCRISIDLSSSGVRDFVYGIEWLEEETKRDYVRILILENQKGGEMDSTS